MRNPPADSDCPHVLKSLEIKPVARPIRGRVRPPGSKSITNRALVCAALADGVSTLTGALDSEDTRVMIDGLGQLGIDVESERRRTNARRPRCRRARFLPWKPNCSVPTAARRFAFSRRSPRSATARSGSDGIERMRERPIGDLLDALNQLGAHATSENDDGCPPVVVHANGLPGGVAKVRGDISSQFLSGLLMAAPAARTPVELVIDGPLVSQPYVRMTLAVMRAFRRRQSIPDAEFNRFTIHAPHTITRTRLRDRARRLGRELLLGRGRDHRRRSAPSKACRAHSLQGDVRSSTAWKQMGCEVQRDADSITVVGRPLHGIDVDMNAISDTVQTLAVVALFADGPTTIRNVAHIRHKETDRIAALATELRKLGADVGERTDGLTIQPGTPRGGRRSTRTTTIAWR